MKRNTMLTVVATMVAVLVCVGFGFHLGVKQQATYSLSKYSDSSEYNDSQKSSRTNPEDMPGYNPGLGVNMTADEEPTDTRIEIPKTLNSQFVTAGELIGSTDEYAWLRPAVSGGIAVKAKAQTDEVWKATALYSVTMIVPDEVFYDGSYCSAEVYYPTSVKAGDTGVIAIIMKSDLGYVYCGYCQFLADDDLQIVYGSSHPQTASGGEFDVDDSQQLSINFYTGATPEHYSNRHGSAGRHGVRGNITVDFIDTTMPDSGENIQG